MSKPDRKCAESGASVAVYWRKADVGWGMWNVVGKVQPHSIFSILHPFINV
jgi:hypothetical protein